MKTITEASVILGRRLRQALALGLALLMLTSASMVPAAETVIYYHLDALGSPVAATNANGTVVWKEDYQPYGNRVEYQDGNTNSLWYTGKERDTAVGLDYFGARWYNPTLGRFNAIDPVDFQEDNIQSFNRYAYANNNPYRYVDPDGKVAQFAIWGLMAALTAYDMSRNAPVPGHENDAIRSIVTMPGPVGVGASTAKALTKSVTPNALQAANLNRFQKKIPSNSKDSVELRELPNGGVAAQATSPGKVPGSKAVYEKQIDVNGKTVQSTKTTYNPQGNIVHVKDKLNGGTYP